MLSRVLTYYEVSTETHTKNSLLLELKRTTLSINNFKISYVAILG